MLESGSTPHSSLGDGFPNAPHLAPSKFTWKPRRRAPGAVGMEPFVGFQVQSLAHVIMSE